MKLSLPILFLLITFCVITAFQCNKYECKSSESRLDASKSWLPLKGKTQLSFLDASGAITSFPLEVVDTVETHVNPDCGATNIYESITAILHLNTTNRDVITLNLQPSNSLIVNGHTNNHPTLIIKDVFKNANEGVMAKRLSNHIVGSKTYEEVILLFQNPKTSNSVDSIFLANKAGIVGFKYAGKKYSLQ